MSLHVSDSYAHILDKARWSHAHGRNVSHISQPDIDAARLFSYGYRSQTIGAFHAAGVAIREFKSEETDPSIGGWLDEACTLLEQLEAKAVDPILPDHRALISTLYTYDRWTGLVEKLLTNACARIAHPKLETIKKLFLESIQKVSAGNGLYIARDLQLPEQGAFVVPDLDISIAPLIYGDNHSWNAAFLAGGRPGVSVHRHHEGAEIHLGYGPVEGHTILGSSFSEVREGYAMPIPPMTDHGFLNTSGHDHVLPFIFGSLKLGGWGVFFDVEPRPDEQVPRIEQPLDSAVMNGSVFLDQVIAQIKSGSGFLRHVVVPAHRAGSRDVGGLELAITRIDKNLVEPAANHYRIVSVQSGRAKITMANVECDVSQHDHFGIPGGIACSFTLQDKEPLVFLDSSILPI